MNQLLLLLLTFLISYSGASQDIIIKRNNSKIKVIIVDISRTIIFYKAYKSNDSTILNMSLEGVLEVIFENGIREKIAEKPDKYDIKIPDNLYMDKSDKIFKNGIFFGAMVGINTIDQKHLDTIYHTDINGVSQAKIISPKDNYFGLSLRVGHKWYFRSGLKWKPGIQVTYAKIGLYANLNATKQGRNSISIGNIGYSNIWKFRGGSGMEVNAIIGYTMVNFIAIKIPISHGVNYSIETKYRFRGLSLGLNYSRIEANFNKPNKTTMNVFSFTVGAKL